MQLAEKEYENSYEGDMIMIDRWGGFEDVPQDYLNSV